MNRENKEELFKEYLDHLLADEAEKSKATDNDLLTAMDFAKKMKELRTAPTEAFRADLKTRLLQKLQEQDAIKSSWFQRMFSRRVIWQVATSVTVILIAFGITWSMGVFQPTEKNNVALYFSEPDDTANQESIKAPTVLMTTTATTTTTTTTESTLLTAGRGMILLTDVATGKAAYMMGEDVDIKVSLTNNTSTPLEIRPYPLVFNIIDANGQPVFTFSAGSEAIMLAPGEVTSFSVIWKQIDDQGEDIKPGIYSLEFGSLTYNNQVVQLEISNPVTFEILP